MPGFRPMPRTFFAAVLILGLLSSYPAQAQDACRFLSGAARALCNKSAAAARSSKNREAEKNKEADEAQPPAPSIASVPAETVAQQPAGIQTPSNVDSSPARGFARYEIAKGGLFVDVSGSYPQGYGPAWSLAATEPQPVVTNRYNVLNHGPQGTETLFVRLITDQGRPALEFARRASQACIADLVGAPQVITATPQQFPLTNFRTADRGQCARTLQSTPPWQGSITLSANADGDLALSLILDLTMPSGKPWFEFTAQNLPIVNKMTPQMAVADLEKKRLALEAKNQAVAANAAREQAAAVARAEEARRIAALPPAGPIYSRQMAEHVQADALGWGMNHLDAGSVGNVRVYSGSVKSGSFILRATYTYNGGSAGWVVAQYSEGKFYCIQFWDSMIGCRTLRKPGEGQAMVKSIVEGMNDSGGSQASQDDENRRANMWIQNNRSAGRNDNGTQR